MRIRDFNIISGRKLPSASFYHKTAYNFPVINCDKEEREKSKIRRTRSQNAFARMGNSSNVLPKPKEIQRAENMKKKRFFLAEKNIREQKTFNTMFQSKVFWNDLKGNGREASVPRSLVNCSSETYDILGNCKKKRAGTSIRELRTMPKIGNKKKAIAELSDLQRLQYPNFHPDYKKFLIKNKHVFRKPRGYCSKLNDEGYKNGKVHKLFYKYRD